MSMVSRSFLNRASVSARPADQPLLYGAGVRKVADFDIVAPTGATNQRPRQITTEFHLNSVDHFPRRFRDRGVLPLQRLDHLLETRQPIFNAVGLVHLSILPNQPGCNCAVLDTPKRSQSGCAACLAIPTSRDSISAWCPGKLTEPCRGRSRAGCRGAVPSGRRAGVREAARREARRANDPAWLFGQERIRVARPDESEGWRDGRAAGGSPRAALSG